MLNKIIHFSLNNRLLVLVCAVLLFMAGIYTAVDMEVDVFPDLNAPTVVVMTEAQGMAPEEVERIVTFPIETAVNGATDVRRVRSASTTGFSVVWVEFDWGTDIYRARQIVSEKLSVVSESLPDYVGSPTLGPQTSILGEVMIVGLTSDTTSLQELRTIADWNIRPRLLSIAGVAQVTVLGGDIKEYQILLDPARMKHYGVTLTEVREAVDEMNRNSTGSVLYESGNEYIVRGMLSTNNTSLMGKALVKTVNDMPVLLEDIARVQVGNKKPQIGIASERAHPAVLLTVTKQPNTGTIDLTEKLDVALADLQKSVPGDVHISTDSFRQSRFINSSISNVQDALLEGSIFVVIVLFLFLMNIRTTVISLVAIPLSLLVAILTLKIFGMTINTMSLGGMAIAIGSLVDDAIVDVENVYKRLRENRMKAEEERKSVIQVVFDASKEVRMPILNSTLIIMASFLPLFFLSGMEGRMLRPLGITFLVSLCASTVVALTLTPVLCSYLLGKESKNKTGREPIVARTLKKVYRRALVWSLNHKKIVVGSTLVLLVAAILTFFSFGRGFLPPFNEGSFTIVISTVPGIDIYESDKLGRQAEQLIMTVPEIQTIVRKTGRAELDEHSFGGNVSEMECPFELGKRSKEEVMAEIREKLLTIPGINIEIGQPITHRIDHMMSGTRANIAIKLFGPDLNHLYSYANRIKSAAQGIEGIADLNVEQQIERAQLKIIPKREILARYGITLPQFSQMVQVMLAGEVVSQVYENDRSFDLTVKVDTDEIDRMKKIRELPVDAGGRMVPLEYIADIVSSSGPNDINREGVKRKIVISANIVGGDLRGAADHIQEAVENEVQLPEGYYVEYGGQFESEKAASRTLYATSIFAILLIFLLLYNEFRDTRQSAVILLNLPLALIGGVFMIWITSGIVSIPAIIGFISLFGIATRNGMLLVTRYNDLTASGVSRYEAIIQGSLDRLNPILMTALSSALALIPLAVNGSLPGNEIQSPMAQVILGGLITSTLLNMFVIPLVYSWIGHKEAKKQIVENEEPES
ncbi:MAG: CusA/CzcA family heavy metal efflux RND transporter [Bacteroidales bacterium]|jgi:Cu(I)/Ag(I) efflux system membrane protein CusA/SilA|nr:CusA/CzcA family heavy metal efflux RND transporter [Bacteroidales bacterium]